MRQNTDTIATQQGIYNQIADATLRVDEAGSTKKEVIVSYLDLRSCFKPLSPKGVSNHIELIDAREV
jgi:hypothetical protein